MKKEKKIKEPKLPKEKKIKVPKEKKPKKEKVIKEKKKLKKDVVIRIVVYILLAIIASSLGGYGYYTDSVVSKLSSSEASKLETIVRYFNNNSTTSSFRAADIILNATLKKNRITIKYTSSTVDNTYNMKYKNGVIGFDYKDDDTTAIIVFKLLIDSVSQYNGRSEQQTFKTVEQANLSSYIIENGLTYKKENGMVKTVINTDVPLGLASFNDYIDSADIEPSTTAIKNGKFTYIKKNVKLLVYKDELNYYVSIRENGALGTNTYNSMITVLNVLLSSTDRNAFNEAYKSIKPSVVNIDTMKVENTPTMSQKELEEFDSNAKFIRVTIPNGKILK